MNHLVKIDPQAKEVLKEIFIYVALNDSYDAAAELLEGIENACYKLESYPERGHIPIEVRTTGIKRFLEIHYKPYRIIYEIEEKVVYIHAVLDGQRNIQEVLNDRLLR